MRIDMAEIGGNAVLAGALPGQKGLARLIERVGAEPDAPTLLFLDFDDVDVATVSYLRESVLAFRDYVRQNKPKYYPIIANANDEVRDDLRELMDAKRDVVMTCRLDDTGNVADAAPLGSLDPKQQVTFDLVRRHGQASAVQLMQTYGEAEKTGVTAWNNRLSGLAGLGLVIVESDGRAKRYRPLFGGA